MDEVHQRSVELSEMSWKVNINNVFAEGVVAEYLHSRDPDTTWWGGHKPLIDVEGDGKRVDAKVAFRESILSADGRLVDAIGFMGSSREIQAREGVTHYGLVEVAATGHFYRVGAEFKYEASAEATLCLVPADVVNTRFFRKWRKDGKPGAGANRYLPMDQIAEFAVRTEGD